MRRFLSLVVVFGIILTAIPVLSFAGTTMAVGKYKVGKAISEGECYIRNYESNSSVIITRDGEEIASFSLDGYNPTMVTLTKGDVIEITEGEVFAYTQPDDAMYINEGTYYAGQDLPIGKYNFEIVEGYWGEVVVYDKNVVDSDGSPKYIDLHSFMKAGDKCTFDIQENQYFSVTRGGFLSKENSLFDFFS